ncbi:MAG: RagB/SusD family nutrient uptake outer membrane protein [Chitinophagaceae bacterium]|nr:MAG: RagB/SusD family nutrient uptake outer membrane protein [Chitinophagaceae bacterium]
MKRKHILIALACFTTMSSCKKLIEIPDTDLIAGNLALSQITFAEQAVLGGYAAVSPDMTILLNATFSDEVAKAEFYNATTTHEWQYGPADVGLRDNFTAIYPNYNIVNRVNLVLAALPTSDSTKPGDEAKRVRLKGECLFLRAFAHFELFRYYAGNYDPAGLAMAYMETSSIVGTPRIDMGTYFQKINADLVAAKGLLPNNLADINRANVAAVAGLQARVALYMRNWAAAETFATEFINAVPLATIATFPGIWTDANTEEQAYRVVKTSTIGSRIGSLFRGTSASASNIGVVTWKPSDKLWSSYNQATDVRFNSYFKLEPLQVAPREQRLIYKYAGGTYAAANENVANGKMLRTAEMVLIRAEARAEQNKITGANSAESDINLLRSNRITGYTNVTFASQQQAIDEIMLERFKELAYEGHRFFDLKRRNLPVTRLPQDAPSAAGTTLPAGNFRFLLPIPLPEVTANPITVQNPGYQ